MSFGVEVEAGLLYRYRPYRPDELRLLLTAGQLRFSNANYFNDPWDCRPLIRIPFHDNAEETARWANWVVDQKVKLGILGGPIAGAVEKERLIHDHGLLQSEIATGGLRVIEDVRAKYRVLCLSEHFDTPLMWSHYAERHTGVCQVFDAHDEVISTAQSIVYLDGYPALDFPNADDGTDMLTPALLTKADYWEYEKEYRILAKENADKESPFLRCDQGYVEIKPTALVGLMLGCQMSPSHQAEAIAIAKAADHKVTIYSALLDENSYGLRFIKQD